ncbi:MAG: GAF domain-containing protein [Bacteroidota bacterium]|nr:GAF domain-containing protein [Bacteroidota bacterium]
MKKHIKLTYFALYFLFLITVFLLFAAVINTTAGNTSSYVEIFILILIGTALFALAMSNYATSTVLERSITAAESNTQKNSSIIEEKKDNNASAINIPDIIPSSATDIEHFGEQLLKNMANEFNIVQALFYSKGATSDIFHCYAQYAYFSETKPAEFTTGETLPGQAVKNKNIVSINNIPDNYMTIASGLGQGAPKSLVFVPLIHNSDIVGLIEYATFGKLSDENRNALEELSAHVAGIIINLNK